MRKNKKERIMLYFGCKKQKEYIDDLIDEIDMKLIHIDNVEKRSGLEKKRRRLCKAVGRGFGIVRVPKRAE